MLSNSYRRDLAACHYNDIDYIPIESLAIYIDHRKKIINNEKSNLDIQLMGIMGWTQYEVKELKVMLPFAPSKEQSTVFLGIATLDSRVLAPFSAYAKLLRERPTLTSAPFIFANK